MRRTNRPEHRPKHRPERAAPASWLRRLVWFAALWAGSILLLGLVAYGIRSMIL